MNGTSSNKFVLSGLIAGFVAVALFLMGTVSSANAWHNGVAHPTVGGVLGGAAVGAIIGGAVKGGKGAAVGAGIGAVVGGAASANAQQRRAAPPPRYYQPAPRPPVYSNNLVYNIQSSLTRLGYNPGPVDGVYGQRTADAIAAYEYNNQLPVTGQATDGIYYHMKQAGG